MRLSGLFDKNKVEIKEGDYIYCSNHNCLSSFVPCGEDFYALVIFKHGAFKILKSDGYCNNLYPWNKYSVIVKKPNENFDVTKIHSTRVPTFIEGHKYQRFTSQYYILYILDGIQYGEWHTPKKCIFRCIKSDNYNIKANDVELYNYDIAERIFEEYDED